MGMKKLATFVLILAVTPAFADSLVEYELQLDGNNHASDITATPIVRTAYTAGDPADNQEFAAGVLNWATTIEVSGLHSQSGHPSDGLATQGVANFVFDIELREGSATGPLVSNADFYSSIHDGSEVPGETLSCQPGGGTIDPIRTWMAGHSLPSQAEFCAGSAYAFSYDINGIGWGNGRVIEAFSNVVPKYTGPFMEIGLYPTVDADNGRILGTGAGYGQWSRTGGLASRTTKGVGLPGPYPDGLGILPVVEGQIDTSLLAEGTYVLVLVPGAGHNVLRGDVDLLNSDPPAFAVPANSVLGDTIKFTIGSGGPTLPFYATSAVSVKTHGTVGDFEINILDRTDDDDIECRKDGTTKLVVAFNLDLFRFYEDNQDVALSSGTVDNITQTASNELTIEMSGTTDGEALLVTFPGIYSDDDNVYECEDTVCIRQLVGDVRTDGSINAADRVDVRNQVGIPVTIDNFRADVRFSDGTINAGDRVDVRNVIGNGYGVEPFLPEECPGNG